MITGSKVQGYPSGNPATLTGHCGFGPVYPSIEQDVTLLANVCCFLVQVGIETERSDS